MAQGNGTRQGGVGLPGGGDGVRPGTARGRSPDMWARHVSRRRCECGRNADLGHGVRCWAAELERAPQRKRDAGRGRELEELGLGLPCGADARRKRSRPSGGEEKGGPRKLGRRGRSKPSGPKAGEGKKRSEIHFFSFRISFQIQFKYEPNQI